MKYHLGHFHHCHWSVVLHFTPPQSAASHTPTSLAPHLSTYPVQPPASHTPTPLASHLSTYTCSASQQPVIHLHPWLHLWTLTLFSQQPVTPCSASCQLYTYIPGSTLNTYTYIPGSTLNTYTVWPAVSCTHTSIAPHFHTSNLQPPLIPPLYSRFFTAKHHPLLC